MTSTNEKQNRQEDKKIELKNSLKGPKVNSWHKLSHRSGVWGYLKGAFSLMARETDASAARDKAQATVTQQFKQCQELKRD